MNIGAGYAEGVELTPSNLTVFPEPTFWNVFVSKSYQLDKEATAAHYDEMFRGRTADEIIAFLEPNVRHIFYYEGNEIAFRVYKRIRIAEYSANIILLFRDGVYVSSRVGSNGVF